MGLGFLLRGLLVGFSVAAPVGPVGILCMRRTLAKGKLSGFVSGLGAATADMAYSCVAAYGLTFVSDALLTHRRLLHTVGGMFLCGLGARIFFTPPSMRKPSGKKRTLVGDFVSTLFLTLTNPMTVFAFIAIFAALGLTYENSTFLSAAALVLGVFLGSSTWWFLLSEGVSALHHKLDLEMLRWVNRISGAVTAAIGVFALFY